MGSNIQVQRICQYCGGDFIARTTVTRYCSDDCAKRAYKERKRAEKVDKSYKETIAIKAKPIEAIQAKEFLSVRDASKLIGCSRQTIYTLINSGQLKAKNILKKKTIIKRTEIDRLLS